MSDTTPMTFFGLIIVFLFLVACYAMYGKNTLKKEAVERGHAEWVVDSNGETEWRWKEVRSE